MNTLHFEGMLQLTFIQICVHLLFCILDYRAVMGLSAL
jgi:hypothetical protein